MDTRYVLDSYAWLEYVLGSDMGKFVDKLIHSSYIITPSIVIAELSDKYHKENNLKDWELLYKFIKHNTEIIALDEVLANKAGKLKKEIIDNQENIKEDDYKMGLTDAIIYQTAKNTKSKLVTGNIYFKNFEDVVYLNDSDALNLELKDIPK